MEVTNLRIEAETCIYIVGNPADNKYKPTVTVDEEGFKLAVALYAPLQGQKIQQIKVVREVCGNRLGLKEAKDCVDAAWVYKEKNPVRGERW